MPWLLTWRTYATHPAFAKRDGRPVVPASHPALLLDAPHRAVAWQSIRPNPSGPATATPAARRAARSQTCTAFRRRAVLQYRPSIELVLL